MSAVATAHVWSRSRATGSTLLVLLAIADACNSDCENSWQSVATLARMARVSESTVHRALTALLDHNEIVWTGDSEHGTRVYALSSALKGGVNLTPPAVEGGVTQRPEGVSPVTPKPTTNPTTTAGNSSPSSTSSSAHEGERIERQGPMTDSWEPTPGAVERARASYPNVNVAREVTTFKAWHQSQNPRTPRINTQSAWDNLFVAWCGRKQEQWDSAHPTENGVRYDETTGMPVNPRPQMRAGEREGNEKDEQQGS